MMSNQWRIWVLIFALAASKAWAADVQWAPVQEGPAQTSLQVSGKVIPKEGALSIESARFQGRVINILKREGDWVRPGDPLFTVSCAECTSLRQEKSGAHSKNITELIEAAAQREQQLGLHVTDDECQILATRGGMLTKRQVELGTAFNVGDSLATILDTQNLTFELEIPESDMPLLRVGQEAKVKLAAGSSKQIECRVEHILPTIDPVTRTGKVRLTTPLLPSAIVDSLVFAQINVESHRQVMRVPSSSVVFNRNERYIVKKMKDRCLAVKVHVLSESDDTSSIVASSGSVLKSGDWVAAKGALFLLKESADGLAQ